MAFDAKRKFRLVSKLVIVALILVSASLFIFKDKKVKPHMSAEDREYTEMYKYKDANGILHYTDIKPNNTEYEVIYMPVSKDTQTLGKTVDGLIGKVFNGKEKINKEEELPINTSADRKASGQANVLEEAIQTLQTAVELYKDAPEALNEAKKVKQQVEKIYQDREKAMEEMR